MIATRHRALLIDDERLARRRLRQLLAAAPDFDVVGECDDARAAAALVRSLRPSVVFLDIRMPHLDGFGVQAALKGSVRHVVFVTAHPEHAARAFDVAATDYLVKPVTQARFNAALDRLRRSSGDGGRGRILLGGQQGGVAVPVDDVVWLEAEGAYVVVHAAGGRHRQRASLGRMIERLGPSQFARVHRSAAINLAHVRAVHRASGSAAVELSTGERVAISRRRSNALITRLRPATGDRPQHETTGDAVSR